MYRSVFRSLIVVVEALMIIAPLFRRGRRQQFPIVLKKGAYFMLTHWELIWKYLEKRAWTIKAVKNFLQSRRSGHRK
jgi:hypothetical protein